MLIIGTLVLITWKVHGFFHSTRGDKKGTLYLLLLLLWSEGFYQYILINCLKYLILSLIYCPSKINNWNLACADDIIFFRATNIRSSQVIMKTTTLYEHQFGQLIDNNNIFYYVSSKDARTYVLVVDEITSFSKGKFRFTRLGCPIRHGMKKKVNF